MLKPLKPNNIIAKSIWQAIFYFCLYFLIAMTYIQFLNALNLVILIKIDINLV